MALKSSNSNPGNTEGGFLRRWSDRKLQDTVDQCQEKKHIPGTCNNHIVDKSDEILTSNRGVEETAVADRNVVKILSSIALARFLHNPESSVLDGMNEYDDDFSYFAPRGDLITQEMKFKLDQLVDSAVDPSIPQKNNSVGRLSAESNSEDDGKV